MIVLACSETGWMLAVLLWERRFGEQVSLVSLSKSGEAEAT